MRLFDLSVVLLFFALLLSTSTAYADSTIEDHLGDARSLYYAGHWEEADEAFESAHQTSEEGTRLRAAAALEWGSLHWEQGNYPRAERLVTEALNLARELEIDEATGELLVTMGHIEASKGELSSAENTLNICIQLTGELGDDLHRALCRLNRRMVRTLQGKDPGSDADYRADLDTLGNAEGSLSVGTSLAKTAELFRNNGDYDRAAEMLDQAEEIYREAGSVPALTKNQLRRAQLMHHRDLYEEARPMLEGLLGRFEAMKNRPMIVHTLSLQAADAIQQSDMEQGVSLYRRALNIAEQIGNPQLIGRVHLALCELNFANSPSHCREATKVFSSTNMRFLEIRAQTSLARTYQARHQFEKSRTTFRKAIEQLEDAVDTSEGPHAVSHTLQYANLCQVEAQLEATGALSTCRQAIEAIENLDEAEQNRHANLRAATIHAAGRTAIQENNARAAIEHLTESAQLYEQRSEPKYQLLAADVLLRLGVIQNESDSAGDDAPDTFERGLKIVANLDRSDSEVAATYVSLKTQLTQRIMADEQWSDSVAMLRKLIALTADVEDDATGAWAYSRLANALIQLDRRDDAVEALESALPLAKEAGDENLIKTVTENLENFRD